MSFSPARKGATLVATLSLAASLGACAGLSRPAPAPVARSEAGTIVQVRPIVLAAAPAPPPPAAGSPTLPVTVVEAVELPVIGDPPHPGDVQRGLSYTVRRTSDGAQFELSQPSQPVLAAGTRVQIVHDPLVRLVPD